MEPFEKLITEYYVPDVKVEVLTYLHMLSYKMIANTEEISMRYGVTRAQFNILNILNQQYPNPCTIGILKERTLVVKSDVSRIVMRLQKAGLVNSTINKEDRRAVDVIINEKGRSLFSELVKHRDELLQPFEALSEEELAQFRSSIRKLLKELERKDNMVSNTNHK